jgi:hypothetical protein
MSWTLLTDHIVIFEHTGFTWTVMETFSVDGTFSTMVSVGITFSTSDGTDSTFSNTFFTFKSWDIEISVVTVTFWGSDSVSGTGDTIWSIRD